ncbi:MAG: hypothetical protein AUK47_20525 [Deltaproteobacteria bacterium CG2_30_63_29]|nr:MAG: hypothetical protein AUK47_20525 [Deltaproteobacteria bacterium CG2_30_63_29]
MANAEGASRKLRLRLPDIGQLLDGRYQIEQKVAGGTYGIVYHATDTTTGERVAVKCLLPSAATSMAVVRRFEREILVIKDLTHPNLISIFGHGLSTDGCLYYVMEYLDGEDLGGRIRRGVLSPRGAGLVAVQVLLALEEAHNHDIVHRDLKPENIYLQEVEDGRIRVRVLDFGIAKVVGERGESMERLTLNNEACGTPTYMAPEQISGEAVGPWTDLYALALITVEMMTGEVVVRGRSFIETLRLQMSVEVAMPESIKGTAFAYVLSHALEKKTKDRYQAARHMREDLVSALKDMSN